MVHFPSPSISSGVPISASHQHCVEAHQQEGSIYGPPVVCLLLHEPHQHTENAQLASIAIIKDDVVWSMCTMLLLDAVHHAFVFLAAKWAESA